MALSDRTIRAAKPRQQPYKLADSLGLYLEVSPAGGRWWRFKYRYAGREKRISLGTYPDTGLAQARERRDEARKVLAGGVDPSKQRQANKVALHAATGNTFKAIALEWFETRKDGWAQSHHEKIMGRLKNHVFPKFGNQPITSITGPELVVLAQTIAAESPDTARRVLQTLGMVFRYGMRTHRVSADPSYKLTEILPARNFKHFAAITDPKAVGALLRAIDQFEGTFVVKSGLRLAPLVFVRPGELRRAEWAEIDLDAGEWTIPAVKMKGKREHLVPLSEPAIAILRELHDHTGGRRYCFPSIRSPSKPMSENTLGAALARLGYTSDQMTVHGFRTTASTLLHELGYQSHLIEVQLAHAEKNEVKAAYNRAQYLPERKKLMTEWAKYLEGLRSGGAVVPIHASKRA
jgi:integrase